MSKDHNFISDEDNDAAFADKIYKVGLFVSGLSILGIIAIVILDRFKAAKPETVVPHVERDRSDEKSKAQVDGEVIVLRDEAPAPDVADV